jgi:glutamine amidotransferase-like uncharacterized protein
MKVLIYQDYVHNNGVLYRALAKHFGAGAVGFCDAGNILEGVLDDSISLFIMPGGADLYYTEKLNGRGNAAIRAWVENGGCYLGICAGAYYACASLAWAPGTVKEITGSRELAFFPGIAEGPLLKLIENGDVARSWLAAPEISYDDGSRRIKAAVCYNGGPAFEATANKNFDILARYPDGAAAIVECCVGAGKAILCSPHLERSHDDVMRGLYRHNNPSWTWEMEKAATLAPAQEQARQMWLCLLERCSAKAQQEIAA